jgi:hypothetical protein
MGVDPFNEELHGLRLYGWVEEYLIRRGWQRRSSDSQWFDNPNMDEYGQNVTIGHAFELQLRDDGVDLEVPANGDGTWQK